MAKKKEELKSRENTGAFDCEFYVFVDLRQIWKLRNKQELPDVMQSSFKGNV
jgi:hypothetical protein